MLEEQRKRERIKQWHTLATVKRVINLSYARFFNKRKAVLEVQLNKIAAIKICKWLRAHLLSDDVSTKNHKRIILYTYCLISYSSMNFIAQVSYKEREEEAKPVLFDFMVEAGHKFRLRSLLLHYARSVEKI